MTYSVNDIVKVKRSSGVIIIAKIFKIKDNVFSVSWLDPNVDEIGKDCSINEIELFDKHNTIKSIMQYIKKIKVMHIIFCLLLSIILNTLYVNYLELEGISIIYKHISILILENNYFENYLEQFFKCQEDNKKKIYFKGTFLNPLQECKTVTFKQVNMFSNNFLL